MTTPPRTPQQRDRRFARVRHVTRGVLVGSGLSSAALVGLFASSAKPTVHLIEPASTTTTSTTTTTTPTATTTTPSSTTVPATSGGTTPTTSAPTTTTSPPTTTTTVPVTTTTQPTCYTSASGIQECS